MYYVVKIRVRGDRKAQVIDGSIDYIAKKYGELLASQKEIRVISVVDKVEKLVEIPEDFERRLRKIVRNFGKMKPEFLTRGNRVPYGVSSQISN